MPFRKKPLNSNSNNNTIFIKIDGQELCATMLRFKLQVCIIRWSNQKLKVVTNFPESYNSPGQFTSYNILVHRTSLGNSTDTGLEVLDFRTSGHF